MARFDWYQATVPVHPREVLDGLSESFADSFTWEDMRKAPQGYGFGRRLLDADGQVLQVWWGGCQEHPHVRASGDTSPAVAEVLRTRWPVHRVSRVDVCEDFAEPGAYDRIQELAKSVAEEDHIKVGTFGDHLVTMKGRTMTLGSRQSPTYMRLYDKAEELRQKFRGQADRLAGIPPELARLEFEIKPNGPDAKARVATAEPLALMGSSTWSRKLMHLVAGLDLEPFEAGKPYRQADDDRAWAFMMAQYGGMLGRRLADQGPCGLGRQIQDALAERIARRGR